MRTITTTEERKLLSFEMQCLRSIACVTRLYRMQNTAIRALTDVNKTITEIIKEKKIKMVRTCMQKGKHINDIHNI